MLMIIEPYRRVGSLVFGCGAAEVVAACGAPITDCLNLAGERTLRYQHMMVNLGTSDSLVEVSLRAGSGARVAGIDPFGGREAVARLVALDKSPRSVVGFVVLMDLGVAIAGLHDDDPVQAAVNAFAAGRYDSFIEDMQPFSFIP